MAAELDIPPRQAHTPRHSRKEEAMTHEKPKVLVADPPWAKGGNDRRKGAGRHYPLMTTERIAAMPIAEIMDDNSSLFLWAMPGAIPDALSVMERWGYTYKSQAIWDKYYLGLGRYFRYTHEVLLFGTRGKPQPWKYHGQRSMLLFPRTRHSEKPAETAALVERVLDGPYLELFARRRPSSNGSSGPWRVWGDGVESDIVVPGYPVPSDPVSPGA